MKYCFLILIIISLANCTKSPQQSGNTDYVLFDSCNISVNTPFSVQINSGTSVIYKGLTWGYNSGYYFNGYNFIYIYGNANDSIYIDYVDTASTGLSNIYQGYRPN